MYSESGDSGSYDFIQRVFEAHDLGPVESVRVPERGSVNGVAIINEALVLRAADSHYAYPTPRYLNEAEAYRVLARRGVPVPEVVLLDTSREIIDRDLLITTLLPGTPLIDAWEPFDEETRSRAAADAGRLLAGIHGVGQMAFGKLHGPHFTTWSEFVIDMLGREMMICLEAGVLDMVTAYRVQAAFEAHATRLDQVVSPALLHSDYNTENLLVDEEGRITGVLDMEWCLAGDPAWDFQIDYRWEATCPGMLMPFYAGYHNQRPRFPIDTNRARLYRVILQLESLTDFSGAEQAAAGRLLEMELQTLGV